MSTPNSTDSSMLRARANRVGMSDHPLQYEPLSDPNWLREVLNVARRGAESVDWIRHGIDKVLARLGADPWTDKVGNTSGRFRRPLAGQRVLAVCQIDRYPHFCESDGVTGVVSISNDDLITVRFDHDVPNAAEWDNCVTYVEDEERDLFFAHWAPNGPAPIDLKEVVDDAVGDAINAGCLAIQNAVGQTDGGHASHFWSGREEELRALFADYLDSEIASGTVVLEEEEMSEEELGEREWAARKGPAPTERRYVADIVDTVTGSVEVDATSPEEAQRLIDAELEENGLDGHIDRSQTLREVL